MQSGNPVLSDKIFSQGVAAQSEVMTQKGAYLKTGFLLLICLAAATFTFGAAGSVWIMPGVLAGLVLALVTVFKKEWSMITAPLYAAAEGLALGAISFAYNAQFQGIVFNAVSLTFAVMAVMLFVYSNKIIQVTDKLRTGIVAATGGIALVYIVSLVMGFFGASIPMIHESGPIGIGFSLLVVAVASFNLLLDFDFIEKASASGRAPKYMEWFAAFGLMVTLVWLYLEMLRLLSKLNRR